MKRSYTRIFMVTLMALIFVGAALPAQASQGYFYNFQTTIQPWSAGSDSLHLNEHSLVLKSYAGNNYAALSANSNGMIWMMTSFQVPATGMNTASINFDAMRVIGSKYDVPVVYIGTTKPISSTQFRQLSTYSSDKWQNYSVEVPVKGSMLVVAIGYKSEKGSWFGIDNVIVKTYVK